MHMDMPCIGSRRELLVDSCLIECFEGVALRLHPPQPQEIAISFDEPWEAGAPGLCTIFQDGALRRMYYRVPPPGCCEDQDPRQMTAYAESADGIHWRKRDKAPIAFPGNYDSQNLIFWDATAACYRAYWRDHRINDPQVPNGRDVRTAVSPDLAAWSVPRWLEYDPNRSGAPELDQTDDPSGDHHQFYTSGVLPYPRAPHLLLGFPQRYCDRGWLATTGLLPDPEHRRRQADLNVGGGRPTRGGTVVTDVLFMASCDGIAFHVWPEAIVRPGIQRPGSWYYGGAWFTYGMLRTPSAFHGAPDELSIYIQERPAPDTPGRLRRHTFRMDGFGSLNAPLPGGRAVTRPFTFDGDGLSINFSTSSGGRLRIGLLEPGGGDISGFSLDDCDLQYGDQIDRVVTWRGKADVGMLAGRPVRLLVELKDADLFAFRFRQGYDEYTIEGWANGRWQPLGKGSCIGHKRIETFKPVSVSKVRLIVTKATAEPIIRRLAVYRTM